MKRITMNPIKVPRPLWMLGLTIMTAISCDEDDLLSEEPLDFLNSDVILVDRAGFETTITSIHQAVRDEPNFYSTHIGTDIATTGVPGAAQWRNYSATLTPVNGGVVNVWNWAYEDVLPRANIIIEFAERPEAAWASEEEKNAIVAEARFFRAYIFNLLANTFGGVPIVEEVAKGPKLDFVRSTRQQVLEFAAEDLRFASQWLPTEVALDGRIAKAAADHLLTEVYISLGNYDDAIASATAVIESGLYNLMTGRFGSVADEPGDPYSDMFRDGNQNRSAGNREMIWAIQVEFETPGGTGRARGNDWVRRWGPRYWALRAPDGVQNILQEPFGRGIATVRPNTYTLFDIWNGDWDNDIRNSENNIRRRWFWNNPESEFFGEEITDLTDIDTMIFFPAFRKIEGLALQGVNFGRTFTDIPKMRLAETYLLRAEAHFLKGSSDQAAADINVVRGRANATPVAPGEVDLDYILDERARELIIEETRRRTLVRMGKLVERVRIYNIREDTRESIEEHHRWYPIPQRAIDSNLEAVLEQNVGYDNGTFVNE